MLAPWPGDYVAVNAGHEAPEGPRLRTLFEPPSLPSVDLPAPLMEAYDGNLGVERSALFANFVSSLDGVVALGRDVPPSVISGKSEADRLVMGLLRALADAVVVGAGTVRTEPDHVWTPSFIFPGLADEFRELRRRLGLGEQPKLVILTNSGKLNPSTRALNEGAIVVTTRSGSDRLNGTLPAATEVIVLRTSELHPPDVLELLNARGYHVLLCEGGPTLLGSFLADQLVDELFLTLAPTIAGRTRSEPRAGFVEGFAYGPGSLGSATLLSAKIHGSHLFLRYRISKDAGRVLESP